jgi:hypothetical protein
MIAGHKLHRDGVPLPLVESAPLLATLRRVTRASDLPLLPKIRSLAYFMPVIEELRLQLDSKRHAIIGSLIVALRNE